MKCLLFLAVLLGATVAATPQASPEETAVRNIVQEEIAAWNSGDAAAYSRHFAADGTFTNIRGEFFTGRQPFIEKHDNLFKGPFHGSTLKQDIVSLKFVRPVLFVPNDAGRVAVSGRDGADDLAIAIANEILFQHFGGCLQPQ